MPNYTGRRSNDFVRRDVVTTAHRGAARHPITAGRPPAGIEQCVSVYTGYTASVAPRNFFQVRESRRRAVPAAVHP